MDMDEFTETLRRLEISQADCARLMGVTARGVNRWAKGDRAIPGPVAFALRTFEMLSASEQVVLLREARER